MDQRFAVCLHADVCGYCRLIAADVESTIKTLVAYRGLISRLVAALGGRVVDTAGDSVLAEFSDVAAALSCAVEMQGALERRNAELPPWRRLVFRVGIDLGQVVAEEGRIYGDCVNGAARVQELAAPGTICLTGPAYDRIGVALPLRYEYLGQRALKNLPGPLRIYRVLEGSDAGAPTPTTELTEQRGL